MPTYEYRCTNCGEHLEVVQSFSDDALTECPDCGGKLRKVFSPVGIVFKGSGFYKTDSRGVGSGAAQGEGRQGGRSSKETASRVVRRKAKSSSSASSTSSSSKSDRRRAPPRSSSSSKKDSKIA